MQILKCSIRLEIFYLIRAKTRPVNPKSLNFSFDDNGIPEGLNIHDILTERQGIHDT